MSRKLTPFVNKPEPIRRLYEVFARYPARPDMPACDHCIKREEVERLCSFPLTEMSDGNLSCYAWHAIWTVGDANDFKHFLPRIFEVMLCEGGSIDAEVIVGKLPCAKWRRWPAEEQRAIEAFLNFWWMGLLARYPAPHMANACLCSMALAIDDIQPYLESWRADWEPSAIRHLAQTLEFGGQHFVDTGEPFSAWWSERPAAAAAFREWLISASTRKKLESAFFAHSNEPWAQEVSIAVQWFDLIIEARARKDHPTDHAPR